MKRILLFIFLLSALLLFSTSQIKVKADSEKYMRVINSTTPFFSDENGENLLFYLPYTYYVKVLNVNNGMAHVEIGSKNQAVLDGYTFVELLFSDNQPVTSPYPEIRLLTCSITTFYEDLSLNNEIRYLFKDRVLGYYGSIETAGEIVYYVSYGSSVGYVKESCLYPFEIPNHPNELTFLDKNEEEPSIIGENKPLNTAFKTVIIACLFLAGIIGLFFSLHSKKHVSTEGGGEEISG
jgi:hypothetical protein